MAKELAIITGTGLEGKSLIDKTSNVIILERHGKDHELLPSDVPYVDLIEMCYEYDAKLIIGVTACGSLREEFKPGMIFLPNQFIDFTSRKTTKFISNRIFNHVSMARPFAESYFCLAHSILREIQGNVISPCTIVTIEGPRFSTRAESLMFKKLGADLINMTTSSECTVANEFGIPYLSVAMVTDYDSWKSGDEVSMEKIKSVMEKNYNLLVLFLNKFIDGFFS